MVTYKYGVFGGKQFGGQYKTINKYFISKKDAVKFIQKYKILYPRRKLNFIRI